MYRSAGDPEWLNAKRPTSSAYTANLPTNMVPANIA